MGDNTERLEEVSGHSSDFIEPYGLRKVVHYGSREFICKNFIKLYPYRIFETSVPILVVGTFGRVSPYERQNKRLSEYVYG